MSKSQAKALEISQNNAHEQNIENVLHNELSNHRRKGLQYLEERQCNQIHITQYNSSNENKEVFGKDLKTLNQALRFKNCASSERSNTSNNARTAHSHFNNNTSYGRHGNY
ncbi:8935_t:CDS:2 [Cetraspora pellucida]|uniref:8935_t:CDS:1 n=1 Tax=Cetraspora pellucida TaxID=1433469 RepID=A0A9N9GER1_9GLOM|nr:8935_t:CDS:2 [Cetraspora pellucida]